MEIPSSWFPPDWRGRRRIEHPVNWGRLPEFDVSVAFIQEKKHFGHQNWWFICTRRFNEGDIQAIPVLAQTVVTNLNAGSPNTITSDATWNNQNNYVEAIGAGSDGGIGSSTSTSGGGGGGGAYTRISKMQFAVPGTTQAFVKVGDHALPAGTVGDSWLTQTGPGTTFPAAAQVGLGAKGGTPLAATTTPSGAAGGASGSAYTNPAADAVTKSGGTGGTQGATNASGGGAGGAGGALAVGASPGTGPSAGGNSNGGFGSFGAGGPAGNGAPAAGLNGSDINGSAGSGGGGGGGNVSAATGGAGGLYGGGGGGGARSTGVKGVGAQGIVVLTWAPMPWISTRNIGPMLAQ